ncbi:hypothetical protein [Novipirellula artificiosorum]|uniref:Uncharacterized protein n=1 Tax=Novipirellula artificiosorum TaxID=2528016 RepID=A0A5C6DL91_9BACT|nr:hypothetical protein [Novipirellula artificiosorum]TWU37372.1 hypothetical protein Poly41_35020 [Novipirellula artificiosorum]
MPNLVEWFSSLQWDRVLPELVGKSLGFLAGFAASWFLLFRQRLNAIARMQSGDSDDFIFQMHRLWELPHQANECVLLFRNVAPKTTLNDLYDNIAVRDFLKEVAENTSLDNPVLKTEGTLGFEVLNDAMGHIAGLLAITPFKRETWLFVMTCEDRQVVRKKCIRCFLIRPDDLNRFLDWDWCVKHVQVEKPWHWFRIVALHRIACVWKGEQEMAQAESDMARDGDMPLVDRQVRHDRIRMISVGLNDGERPIGDPHRIDWESHVDKLQQLGLTLAKPSAMPERDPEPAEAIAE